MPENWEKRAHEEWLGYVQPGAFGLVVSLPVLLRTQPGLDRNFRPQHERLLAALPHAENGEPQPRIADLPAFFHQALDWDLELLNGAPGAPPVPASLAARLETYNEVLQPGYALRDYGSESAWLLLIQPIPPGAQFEDIAPTHDRGWQASHQARFERLLRDSGVPAGLIVSERQIRLVYAPEAEATGYLTFDLGEMVQIAGRPIWAACRMLLGRERLFLVDKANRLAALLEESRKYQNTVSVKLAAQVTEALFELLRGFQSADAATQGELLDNLLRGGPDEIYRGLVTALLRIVFLLYAEDHGLLPGDAVFVNYYSLFTLHARLRAEDGRFHDTMHQRYGAWAQLLAVFRLVYAGGVHGGLKLPPRRGYLFDPARFPFLEGGAGEELPRVSDAVVHRVLDKLIVLEGERLSYSGLNVEQIGGVYQAIMGFELERARGRSIAIRTGGGSDAPVTVNLDELLASSPASRKNKFEGASGRKLPPKAAAGLRAATTLDELVAALDRVIARSITPHPVPAGAMILQPSGERRRSGSHYTPRSFTAPIVRATLQPVLAGLGPDPRPEAILNLKVCDLAVGSGAFLVEACRQLGDALIAAWHRHNAAPALPPDEDEVLAARRLIAQRCLYGVDANPLATDLAKLSLWLETMAKDHPFTFLDHALRSGDSLVGLTRAQLEAADWKPGAQGTLLRAALAPRVAPAIEYRRHILEAREDVSYEKLQEDLARADAALGFARQAGGAVLAAFFSGDTARGREESRRETVGSLELWVHEGPGSDAADVRLREACAQLEGKLGAAPFHWEIEFPEVFGGGRGGFDAGFDAIVGNPPFAGKNTLLAAHGATYMHWLQALHEGAHGNSDLAAHFFRRAFALLRPARGPARSNASRFGLIATNTIAQGDTRGTGLRWICEHGGVIYNATRRKVWPGEAAVVVSVVHIARGEVAPPYWLDGREVPVITAFLFHAGGHDDPARLLANADKSFQGSIILGLGFTFDDNEKSAATPLAEMHRLIASDQRNAERIFPYLGGDDVNSSPTQAHHRYVINFEDYPLKRQDLGARWAEAGEAARRAWLREGIVPADYPGPVAADWPDLLAIVEAKVKPKRDLDNRENYRRFWWRYGERRPGLQSAIAGLDRVLVISRVGAAFAFARVAAATVHADSTDVVASENAALFAAVQSRPHEVWARFFSSSLEERLRYTPSDCFETFPFPNGLEGDAALERLGQEYHEFRAELMRKYNVGLTTTYNWFHDRDDGHPEIVRLRELHGQMDAAVLAAYGWGDLDPVCEFREQNPDEDEEAEESGRRPRTKKYRYAWSGELHDEVLARLLQLNRERAAGERAHAAGGAR